MMFTAMAKITSEQQVVFVGKTQSDTSKESFVVIARITDALRGD